MENSLEVTFVVAYSMCMIVQIFGPSFFGSRLSYASEGITWAMYESDWTERNRKCKFACMIFIERTLRPMVIYAGGLFPLSLLTFLRVR